eukprot:g8365.t1
MRVVEDHHVDRPGVEEGQLLELTGLGYVGFPLAVNFHRQGLPVIGFDIDQGKIDAIASGQSYIPVKGENVVRELSASDRFQGTTDPQHLSMADVLLICVPTPLTENREPDMSYVLSTLDILKGVLRPGQLVILESTTYPGTTVELIKPFIEDHTDLTVGKDVFLAYSPEREDPGNLSYGTSDIPKVVGADDPHSARLATLLYQHIVPSVTTVGSSACAEAVKITENVFRCVNIALVNELKTVYQKMGIDVWEVINAAKTKPFGFMPFYPGPGLGGHCIPVDPFYLSWKARAYDMTARFVELAGEINRSMPDYVIQRLREALDEYRGKGIRGSRVLVLGVAYKKNVSDVRESPALALLKRIQDAGGDVVYHDPHVPVLPLLHESKTLEGMTSWPWDPQALGDFDVVLVCTDHDHVDYDLVAQQSQLVVDTRRVVKGGQGSAPVVLA